MLPFILLQHLFYFIATLRTSARKRCKYVGVLYTNFPLYMFTV